MSAKSTKVIVGLSGGVDSAVAALRLLEQGYTVEGLFMKNWEDDDTDTECPAEHDVADAKQVCAELGIPLHQANFAADYKRQVFDHCLREFEAGRTPNPDVLCNREIKFKAFLDHALRLGGDFVATGHYARIDRSGSHPALLKGLDANKDQSYFLHLLDQSQLGRSLFPIGELEKPRVREMAEQAGFDNFEKKDSTGICFIGERDFRGFLGRYLASRPGPIRSVDGEALGTHQGLSFYTLGQRQGLGIGGVRNAGGEPWYVVAKDMGNDTLLVAQGHDHPALHSQALIATDVHWISGERPTLPLSCMAKTRYRQRDQACTILQADPAANRVRVTFATPQRAVTPGQSVVFYVGEQCLGGGIIDQTERRP